MLCQECGKRPATLHFTKIINGDKSEYRICETCAREKGEMIPGTSNGFSIHNLLSGLLDFDLTAGGGNMLGQKPPQSLRCESCGLTYSQFSKIGRFGCSECYKHFSDRLDSLFRRVHGTTAHAGKIPKRTGGQIQTKREIDTLKKELLTLVEREEFEQAAQLRDKIRDLEKKISGD